jgi:hypothetical protein
VTPETFDKPYLIICEGKSDEAFLHHLLEARNLHRFQYAYPEQDAEGRGTWGKDGIDEVLRGIKPLMPATLQGIIIVLDTDSGPDQALRFAQRKIREAGDYDVPNRLLEFSESSEDLPPIIVITLPWINEIGNLETLIVKAVQKLFPNEWTCLTAYCNCTKHVDEDGWSVGKQSKMRLQCLMSAVCKDDPTCAVSVMWGRDKGGLFTPMLADDSFDQVVAFFRGLP